MYGMPGITHFGAEPIPSFDALIEAIKRRQVLKPKAKLAMQLGGAKFQVNYTPTGHIELDGRVPSLHVEREIEEAIASIGAQLVDVVEN